jgi:hypothetical protein
LDFGGWFVPVSFSGRVIGFILIEYLACFSGVSVEFAEYTRDFSGGACLVGKSVRFEVIKANA